MYMIDIKKYNNYYCAHITSLRSTSNGSKKKKKTFESYITLVYMISTNILLLFSIMFGQWSLVTMCTRTLIYYIISYEI